MIGAVRIWRILREMVESFLAIAHNQERILHIDSRPGLAHQQNIVLVILDVEYGRWRHGESCLNARCCLFSHSAPIGPSGWLACRKTLTASSIALMSPASRALMSVK